jgi:hypothetical protein
MREFKALAEAEKDDVLVKPQHNFVDSPAFLIFVMTKSVSLTDHLSLSFY